jgi:hypothetical protein
MTVTEPYDSLPFYLVPEDGMIEVICMIHDRADLAGKLHE